MTTELRIGNWVNQPQLPHIAKITAIDYSGDDYSGDDYYCKFENIHAWCWCSHLEPIPLTEELLLKCGFEKSQIDLRCAYVPHAYVGLRFEKGDFRYYKESDKWSYRATRIDNPIFLHQLQNLYFALAGKELEIKL